MSTLALRAIAVLVLFASLGLTALLLVNKGRADCRTAQAQLVAQATAQATATDIVWKARLEQVQKDSEARDRSIAAAHSADLAGLRNRPERRIYVPGPAASACEGGTGAGLSRPDAGVLEGESTRANVIRAALAKCYDWIDAVTNPIAK